MHQRTHPHDAAADGDWLYSETIDAASSTIRVRGQVGRLGVDLLRATIEDLHRRGHPDITVAVEHPARLDAHARRVLAEVSAELAADGGRLTIATSADDPRGGGMQDSISPSAD
jgi:hypothetical protein